MLPQQSSKPVRVCLDCYDSLSQTKNEQVCIGVIVTSNDCIEKQQNIVSPISQNKSILNPKSNNNSTVDSSGDDDSDDDEDPKETHDEVSERSMYFIHRKSRNPRTTFQAFRSCSSLSTRILKCTPLHEHVKNHIIYTPCVFVVHRVHVVPVATVSKSLHGHLTHNRML